MKKLKPTKKPLHLTTQEVVDFIDNKPEVLDNEELIEHLVYCKRCSELIINTRRMIREEEKNSIVKPVNNINSIPEQDKPKIVAFETPNTTNDNVAVAVNNSWFRNEKIRAVVLSGLVASFALVFMLNNQNNDDEFYINTMLHIHSNQKFKSGSNQVSEALKSKRAETLQQILNTTDMKGFDDFYQAEKALKNNQFEDAYDGYIMTKNEVEDTLSGEEKLKKIIFLQYKLFKVSYLQENNSESTITYGHKLQTNLDNYYVNFVKKGK